MPDRMIKKYPLIQYLASLVVALILLTQISACLRIPREVHAELEPESAPHNHFNTEPSLESESESESGNKAKTTQ
jgi:hypothetical protein